MIWPIFHRMMRRQIKYTGGCIEWDKIIWHLCPILYGCPILTGFSKLTITKAFQLCFPEKLAQSDFLIVDFKGKNVFLYRTKAQKSNKVPKFQLCADEWKKLPKSCFSGYERNYFLFKKFSRFHWFFFVILFFNKTQALEILSFPSFLTQCRNLLNS